MLPFDATLAGLSAEGFVQEVLVEGLHVRHASTGYDFFFGKGREGNPKVLRALGNKYDFGVTIVEAVGSSGEIYSSTRIRELLAEGDVASAADMLGYFWCVDGVVEQGAGRGTGMGFPTANIRLRQEAALSHGIYAVRVEVDGSKYHGRCLSWHAADFRCGGTAARKLPVRFRRRSLWARRSAWSSSTSSVPTRNSSRPKR